MDLEESAKELCRELGRLRFGAPVTHVYNPLVYAWPAHQEYLRRYAHAPKRVVFFGMNPGPFGMTQTGVPFGEIGVVRDWLKINTPVAKPEREHPKRPVQGFDCPRSEVSGKRLWGLFAERFGTPEAFFAEHFVANYCPLAFCEKSGCNRTPDKLPARELAPLLEACDKHLLRIMSILQPEWIVGVGDFAEKRAQAVLADKGFKIGKILHPSPASPAANRGWAERAVSQLISLGVWNSPRGKASR